jgi:hypothetical protein
VARFPSEHAKDDETPCFGGGNTTGHSGVLPMVVNSVTVACRGSSGRRIRAADQEASSNSGGASADPYPRVLSINGKNGTAKAPRNLPQECARPCGMLAPGGRASHTLAPWLNRDSMRYCHWSPGSESSLPQMASLSRLASSATVGTTNVSEASRSPQRLSVAGGCATL